MEKSKRMDMNWTEYIRLYADVKAHGDEELSSEEKRLAWASMVQAGNDVLEDFKKALKKSFSYDPSISSIIDSIAPLDEDILSATSELKPKQKRGL